MHLGRSGGLHLKRGRNKRPEITFINFDLPAVYAGGSGRPVGQHEPAFALEHDLTVVLDFPHIRSVVVEAHIADQKHLQVCS